jgi:hypothetical protein
MSPDYNPPRMRPLLALTVLLALTACGDRMDSGTQLLSCERLAFVPAGVVAGRLAGSSVDLLVDRFEVTRDLWNEVRRGGADLPDLSGRVGLTWSDGAGGSLPATGMDAHEAVRLAGARGLRLPTTGEWLYIAAGSRAQHFPWGNSLVATASNTWETGLARATPVGTFPSGATAGGVYDLVGNVWEWTDAPVLADFLPLGWAGPDAAPYSRWAMGGSYNYSVRPLFDKGAYPRVLALGRELGSRSSDVGLRCVAAAEDFLRTEAAEWSSPAVRERVVAVGRSWGSRSVRLLERLAAEPGAPPALGWLLEGARS